MDVLLQAKTEMLMKRRTLEQTRATVVNDVNELKNSFEDTNLRILELKNGGGHPNEEGGGLGKSL